MSEIHPDVISHLKHELRSEGILAANLRRKRADAAVDMRQMGEQLAAVDAKAASLRELLRRADPQNADQYTDPHEAADHSRRRLLLDGLLALVDYYEQHPDIPTPGSARLHVFPRDADPEAEEAQVSLIAAAMGLKAGRSQPNHHFEAEMKFGEAVELSITSTTRTVSGWQGGDPYPDWWPTQSQPDHGECLDERMLPDEAETVSTR